MHFILDGRVGVFVNRKTASAIRVRSLGRQTTIGEMGLISGRARSGTLKAEAASMLYELSRERLNERSGAKTPCSARRSLSYVTEVMAERLGFASRVIGVLQR